MSTSLIYKYYRQEKLRGFRVLFQAEVLVVKH